MTKDYNFKRIASLKTADNFQAYLDSLGIELPFDRELQSGSDSPLGQSYTVHGKTIGNRFSILPMEGWDGTLDGFPSDLTIRRWHNFGDSGAKLIWGGEAIAVRHDGRANPNQLISSDATASALESLRTTLLDAHQHRCGKTDDLLLGLQLTHSGRFSRPNGKSLESRTLYRHPILDKKFHIEPEKALFSDGEIDDLIGDFVKAAIRAQQAGYEFVDLKHCHGYLGHEFLSAHTREGKYGGSLENRTRFLRDMVSAIRRDAPGLHIGVRLSAFDLIPFRKDANERGEPEDFDGIYNYGFGVNKNNPLEVDLTETFEFLQMLQDLDIKLVCISSGSPYYIPHIQRPAIFPPSDGYLPPEDPLVGVARLLNITAQLKARFPELLIVGTGYSYLQEWLANVGQYYVRTNKVDFVGMGRIVLSYHDMPDDVLHGRPLQTTRLCRTFSDCTTAPRNGLVSGCYPLDPLYKTHPQATELKIFKQQFKSA